MSEIFPREWFTTGEMIFREGGSADCAYIIESGEVTICKAAGNKEAVLATLGPGAIVGEFALIDNAPRMASARAAEPTTLLKVNREQFRQKIDQTDPFIRKLLTILVENVRSITDRHISTVTS